MLYNGLQKTRKGKSFCKLTDFITTDLEDLYDEERPMRNEQAEITKLYEKLPSPCITATEEFLANKLMHRSQDAE